MISFPSLEPIAIHGSIDVDAGEPYLGLSLSERLTQNSFPGYVRLASEYVTGRQGFWQVLVLRASGRYGPMLNALGSQATL